MKSLLPRKRLKTERNLFFFNVVLLKYINIIICAPDKSCENKMPYSFRKINPFGKYVFMLIFKGRGNYVNLNTCNLV